MERKAYPSDVSDAEWALVAPYLIASSSYVRIPMMNNIAPYPGVAKSPDKMAVVQFAWDKFGTKIVSMWFISVHFGSLTVGLQPK